jgi:peptide-methionine (R)-S-oxide reductase
MTTKINKTDAEWRAILTSEQYHVLRQHGTERPFTGEYVHNQADGTYCCAACGQALFSSDTKFESGTGWPSFWDVIAADRVILRDDFAYGMHRVEVLCSACESHLGHVFPDGPRQTTGQRYCMNSVALNFKADDEA